MLALCTAATFFAAVFFGIGEGEFCDFRVSFFRADFETLHHPRHDLMLDAGVESLGILADDDQVDVLIARFHTRQIFNRPQIGVEIESLA